MTYGGKGKLYCRGLMLSCWSCGRKRKSTNTHHN
jgi:hypothetical protein